MCKKAAKWKPFVPGKGKELAGRGGEHGRRAEYDDDDDDGCHGGSALSAGGIVEDLEVGKVCLRRGHCVLQSPGKQFVAGHEADY